MAGVGVQPLVYQDQLDLSAGAFPGLEVIPPNGAEDIVNGVIADDGSVFRRGAPTYKSQFLGTAGTSLWDGELAPGPRTVMVSTSGAVYALDATDANVVAVPAATWTGAPVDVGQRPVEFGRTLIIPASAAAGSGHTLNVYGGSLGEQGTVLAPPGLVTLTQGSKTVTGSGTTTFLTDAHPGALLFMGASSYNFGVVESVQSNTQLTLTEPWPWSTTTNVAGYQLLAEKSISLVGFLRSNVRLYAAQIARRLVLGQDNKVYFSQFLQDAKGITYPVPFLFGIDEANPNTIENVWTLPEGSRVTGLMPLRDVMMVFTSAGVWGIYNMALELTDAAGNLQQRLEQINRDVILWANGGISTWRNALIVPALDDLYLMDAVGRPEPITGGARRLYRSYAKAGYLLGPSAVYRGHYFLPIVSTSNDPVDQLVWRLDAPGVPFTRWSGYGGLNRALVQRTRAGLSPQLLGLAGTSNTPRITDLTSALDPDATGSATDPNGGSYDLTVTTRTVTFGDLVPDTFRRFRARLEGASTSPSVSLEYATGRPGSSFVSASSPQVKTDDNEQVYSWALREKTRAIRFRLTIHSGASREVLRSIHTGARVSAHHRP